jgi:hypothetical protein
MCLDAAFIEHVDDIDLGMPTAAADFSGGSIETRLRSAGDENARALAGKRVCDRAADDAATAINDRNLFL